MRLLVLESINFRSQPIEYQILDVVNMTYKMKYNYKIVCPPNITSLTINHVNELGNESKLPSSVNELEILD
jgi:hypothetical protein